MFNNILTNNNVNFKELEEKFYKVACSMVNEMFKIVLEKYDDEILHARDSKKFRNKGKEKTCIKTKTGTIEYERRKYVEKNEDGTTTYRYLLDEELGITKAIGHVSEGLIELIIKNISELSYRACSKMIEDCTGMNITGTAIWNIIQTLGIDITQYEDEKIKAYEEEKLEAGTKVTPILFQEADGIMIVMQGKDRAKRIEEYQKAHPNEEVPKKVRNGELKLGMTYEGWKKESEKRYKLVGKEYVSGFMDGNKMAQIMKSNIYGKYDVKKIEINVTNSDGANWLQKLVPEGGIYQADTYHLKEKVNTHIREKEDAEKVMEMYWKQEYTEMIEYVENLKYEYGGEYEEVEKLEELKKYLEKRKNCMKRYNADKETKRKLKKYSKETGLLYRNMGCQESNNYVKITKRFKRRRMSWSEKGATNLAKVITTYASENCTNIFEYLNIQILPEGFQEYVERYIKEIEDNIKKYKKEKANQKPKIEPGIMHGSIKNPIIEKVLKAKEISELKYT